MKEKADTSEGAELSQGGGMQKEENDTDSVMSKYPQRPNSVLVRSLFPKLEEIGMHREKRATEEAEEDSECSGGSGCEYTGQTTGNRRATVYCIIPINDMVDRPL